MSHNLAVIIPMYNEERNAEKCVISVCKVLIEKLPDSVLFIVNDGSKDKTEEILLTLAEKEMPFRLVSYAVNKGFGGAIHAGMIAAHNAGYEYGLVMDSDLTNDPNLIPNFAEIVSTGNYDLVKASRYVTGGGMKGVPAYRMAFTIVGNFIASKLFGMGVKDCTNGFHAVRLSLLVNEVFHERGFPFLLEEMYVLMRKKAKTAEMPYILTARKAEEGQSKFTYRPKLIWTYLSYALKAALFRLKRAVVNT
jgi:dolichol-phosphate mannosyltransferase